MTNARHWQLEVAATTAKEAATKMLYCHVLEIQCSPCHSLRRTSGNTVGRWCATKPAEQFREAARTAYAAAYGTGTNTD
jgi:hypothetical protein